MNKVKDGDFIDTDAFSWCQWPEEPKEKKKKIESGRLICSWIDHRLLHHLWIHGAEHSTWIERRCSYE